MSIARDAAVRGFLCGVVSLIFLLGASVSWAESRPLRLGLWPYHTPQHLVSYYEGLRQHLEIRLGRPVHLETASTIEVFTQRTFKGEYDIALIAPHLGRLAQIDHGWQPIAGYKDSNTVYLVARQHGEISKIADLKGKIIATQDRGMLLSLSARKWLKSQGLAENDYQWLETGGLASSVYSVVSGEADAGVATLASLSLTPQAELDQLRIIGNAGSIPQLYLIASPSTKSAQIRVLRQACLDFRRDGKSVLGMISDKELRSMDDFAAQGRAFMNSAPAGRK
jgi:phosphonate transport system substrate-binding protein